MSSDIFHQATLPSSVIRNEESNQGEVDHGGGGGVGGEGVGHTNQFIDRFPSGKLQDTVHHFLPFSKLISRGCR